MRLIRLKPNHQSYPISTPLLSEGLGEALTPPLPQPSPTHSLVVVVAGRLVYQVV